MKNFLHKACLTMLLFVVGVCSGWADKSYTKVTDASTLASGDVIILACESKSVYAGAMGGNSYFSSTSNQSDAIEITLGGSSAGWTLTTSEGKIGASTVKSLNKGGNGTTTWTISINEGNATIKSTTASYGSILYNAASPRFLNYASGQTAIQIFKVEGAGGGTTEPNPETFSFTVDIVGNGSVTFVDGNGTSVKAGDELESGSKITPTCTAGEGYEYSKWEYLTGQSEWKSVSGTTFTITKNVDFRFTFTETQSGTDPVVPSGSLVYKKVTSQSDIVAGGVYIIVCETEKTAMGSQNSNRRNNANVTISNGTISVEKVNEEGYPYEVTLANKESYYTMTLSNGSYLGNGAKGNNYLKEVQNYAAGYGWTLTYSDGNVTMKTNHNETVRYLCVNTANTDSYATYTSFGSYEKVTLYKKIENTPSTPATATITLNPACTDGEYVYGTYSNTNAFVANGDIIVYEVFEQNGQLSLLAYETNAVVPANTGVLVAALEGGNYEVNLTSEKGESVLKTSNCLRPTGNGITAADMAAADAGKEYFRLTMQHGTDIGFWWGAENGEAFNLGANKAYLVAPVPTESNHSARSLWFNNESGVITSVNSVVEVNESNAIYNLQGQRVQRTQRGVYVVNGKKVIR